jgi:2-oxoglutarate dehydrogenase E1 component
MYISDYEQRSWIYSRLEKAAGSPGLQKAEKVRVLEALTAAEGLERFLHTKYVGQKRFSLEGGESMIPMVDDIVRAAGDNGVKEVIIGMAHRGRLNVLVNILGKAPSQLFNEFEGKFEHDDSPMHTGDVKYHLGFSADVKTPNGGVHVALAFNPSHLEIVNPVVAGSVHARQSRRRDTAREKSMALLIHGDAAFAGQGVNMELMQMSQARGFAIGGTLHIVINNQVGFTTSKREDARSTLYCTDLSKMVNAPVFHVNGDDPEAVLQVTRLAYEFRKEFKKDVVIDLVCYRRHGHNEADEPAATQPLMYQVIRKRPTTRDLYAQALVKSSTIGADDGQKMLDDYRARLEKGEPLIAIEPNPTRDIPVDWTRFQKTSLSMEVDTGVPREQLAKVLDTILTLPSDVTLHARVAKIYDDRRKMAAGDLPGDWGFAENLAYGTLIAEGNDLRIVGQDAGRGTFFHRHAVLHRWARCAPTPASTSSTRCSPKKPSWPSSTAKPRPRLTSSPSGKASSAISPTAPRSSSTSSSARAKPSGTASAALRCCCRTARKAPARSIPPPVWSVSSSCARSTTCRSACRPRRPRPST